MVAGFLRGLPRVMSKSERRCISDEVSGSVRTWRSSFGWIWPDDAEWRQKCKEKRLKGMFIHRSDVEGDLKLKPKSRVSFTVWEDDSRFGAENCRLVASSDNEPEAEEAASEAAGSEPPASEPPASEGVASDDEGEAEDGMEERRAGAQHKRRGRMRLRGAEQRGAAQRPAGNKGVVKTLGKEKGVRRRIVKGGAKGGAKSSAPMSFKGGAKGSAKGGAKGSAGGGVKAAKGTREAHPRWVAVRSSSAARSPGAAPARVHRGPSRWVAVGKDARAVRRSAVGANGKYRGAATSETRPLVRGASAVRAGAVNRSGTREGGNARPEGRRGDAGRGESRKYPGATAKAAAAPAALPGGRGHGVEGKGGVADGRRGHGVEGKGGFRNTAGSHTRSYKTTLRGSGVRGVQKTITKTTGSSMGTRASHSQFRGRGTTEKPSYADASWARKDVGKAASSSSSAATGGSAGKSSAAAVGNAGRPWEETRGSAARSERSKGKGKGKKAPRRHHQVQMKPRKS